MSTRRMIALVLLACGFVIGCGAQQETATAPQAADAPAATPQVFEGDFEGGQAQEWTDAKPTPDADADADAGDGN